MSLTDQAPATTLIRLSAVAGERRADLVLPGAVPVIELLPEIVRAVGILDREMVHGGCRLVAQDGRVLESDATLLAQSIDDGQVLSVVAGIDEELPTVYDDAVEAMSDAVESEVRPWKPETARRSALAMAVLLLVVGAGSLALQRPSMLAGAAGLTAAAVLAVGAIVLAHVRKEGETAVVLAWMAVLFGVVGGAVVAPGGDLLALPAAIGGAAAAAFGLIGFLGLLEYRHALMPAVVAGAVLAVTGGLAEVVDVRPAALYAVALVLVAIVGAVLPSVAIGSAGAKIEQAHTHADLVAEPKPIDPERVRAQARAGHDVLLATTASVGLVLVITAPIVVSLGVAGALLPVCAAAAVMVRTRQYRSGSEVLTGLIGGGAALLATAVAAAVLWPEWRPALTVVLAAVGACLLATTVLATSGSVRRGRLGDLAEGISLVALLPLLVFATGLFSAVRG